MHTPSLGLRAGLALVTLTVFSACDGGTSAPATVRYSVDGPAALTFTGSDGSTESAVATGAWQQSVSVEPGTAVVLTAASSSGAPVTATLTVDDALSRSRRGQSVRLESSSDDDSGELEVCGPVEALTSDRVTVDGRVFVVDAGTRLFDRNNATVALATFTVGTIVEAEGQALADGTVRASKVKLENDCDEDEDGDDGDEDGPEIEIHGSIQAIGAASMTVGGRVFATDAATRYFDDRHTPIARSAFQIGERVEAEGHVRADGTVLAQTIKRDDD